MAYSYVRYTGNGSTVNYTFSFPYISSDHIKVRLNGVLTTAFTFLNSSTIQFTSAPASGVVIDIRRETPKDSAIVNFTDGSVLLERDLDLLATYDLYLAQETKDSVDASIAQDSLGVFDAQSRRIKNVADPVNAQDAVTKSYTDAKYAADLAAIQASQSAAASSATTASTKANEAAASAVSAANSAAAAATALDNFDDRYLGQKASDPSVDNDGNPLLTGALYYNTTDSVMRVYTGTGWINASSAQVATMKTYVYVATAGQTVFSGNDANGSSLTFVAPYIIVSLNGLQLRPTVDFTMSGGSSVTLTSAAAVGDELQIQAFASFNVANIQSANVTYSQGGTGASTRSVDAKLKEVKSVADFPSLDAAVAACSDGDTLLIPVGVWGPLSAKLTKGIKFVGQKKPTVKADLTGLEKGSIIRGPLIYDADNCEFHDLGVDSGSSVCATYYGNAAQEGLCCTVTYATADHYNLRVRNVVCIAKNPSAAVHAFAAERQVNADINGVETVFGTHGQAYKVIRSNISNLIAKRSGGNGIIIKRDEFASCYDSNFNNVVVDCYDGGNRGSYGIVFDSHRGDDGATPGNLYGINLSNFTVIGANWHGVMVYGAGTSTDIVADINLSNGVITDCLLDGFTTYGNTLRVTLTNVQSKACGRFGFSAGQDGVTSRSNTTKFIGCFAGNCSSGFVGRGLRFYTIGCEASSNTNWGFYAKGGSSSYRGSNRGRQNGTALYGSDSSPTTYWFEMGMPYQETVYSPTLINSWVNFDSTQATWQGARYWLGSDGMVHLSGVIKNGTLNTPAFSLPEGFRPPTYRRFNANGLGTLVDLFIDAYGAVVPVSGTNSFVSLDGISFLPSRAD